MNKTYKILTCLIYGLTSLLTACSVSKNNGEYKVVDYQLAHGYFVRNDAPDQIPALYDTQAEFDSIFGKAVVMGENGRPTSIDFDKKSVVAVATPVTSVQTDFEVGLLEAKDDELVLKCKVVKGDTLGYFIRPCLVLVINKYPRATNVILDKK